MARFFLRAATEALSLSLSLYWLIISKFHKKQDLRTDSKIIYVLFFYQIDNLIIISDTEPAPDDMTSSFMTSFLERYRRDVNPNLLYVNVGLRGRYVITS